MNPIGNPFVQLGEVESSNNYAMAQVQARLAEHGAAWFANYQIAGKGQRGKTWEMQAGQNIILSVVIEPKALKQVEAFLISAMTAVASHQLFSKYALDETKIKWPNDIYWRDRKAGGILIENIFKGNEWTFSIVGIGININQVNFPANLTNAVSLKQITGKTFDCIALAKELCEYLEYWWRSLFLNKKDVLEKYNQVIYKLNEKVRFERETATLEAIVKGVDKDGKLIVKTLQDETISYGDWRWIIEGS